VKLLDQTRDYVWAMKNHGDTQGGSGKRGLGANVLEVIVGLPKRRISQCVEVAIDTIVV
jgi:hypothetical protein